MNPEILLYLEENGFNCDEPWEFFKKIFIQEMTEVLIYGARCFEREHLFGIDICGVCIDSYGNSYKRGIAWMVLYICDDFDSKIKKIINAIDEIVTISLTFRFAEFEELPNLKVLSDHGLVHLDFSEDELKIIDYR